jgi:hypothetical protein
MPGPNDKVDNFQRLCVPEPSITMQIVLSVGDTIFFKYIPTSDQLTESSSFFHLENSFPPPPPNHSNLLLFNYLYFTSIKMYASLKNLLHLIFQFLSSFFHFILFLFSTALWISFFILFFNF